MRIRRLLPGLCVMAPPAAACLSADVAGRWDVRISTAGGTINGLASLEQAGDDVTGWVGPSESDPIPVTGTFIKGKLVMKTHPQPGRTVAFERGSHGNGTITFVRSK